MSRCFICKVFILYKKNWPLLLRNQHQVTKTPIFFIFCTNIFPTNAPVLSKLQQPRMHGAVFICSKNKHKIFDESLATDKNVSNVNPVPAARSKNKKLKLILLFNKRDTIFAHVSSHRTDKANDG